ncbi:MAG: hypothetical protein JWL72_4002 [Ilumatobacteraceae bacterium]|nr:hypothetical protein [Ilumatobacteraceae bacterium]
MRTIRGPVRPTDRELAEIRADIVRAATGINASIRRHPAIAIINELIELRGLAVRLGHGLRTLGAMARDDDARLGRPDHRKP